MGISLNYFLLPWSKSGLKSWQPLICFVFFFFFFVIFSSVGNLLPPGNNPHYSHRLKKKKQLKSGNIRQEGEKQVNVKTAGQAAVWRPWKVGLWKELQKPWETLSKYIKDTTSPSSLLPFLPHSSSAFSRLPSFYASPEVIFLLLYTSAVCFLIGSFVWTCFLCRSFSSDPTRFFSLPCASVDAKG